MKTIMRTLLAKGGLKDQDVKTLQRALRLHAILSGRGGSLAGLSQHPGHRDRP